MSVRQEDGDSVVRCNRAKVHFQIFREVHESELSSCFTESVLHRNSDSTHSIVTVGFFLASNSAEGRWYRVRMTMMSIFETEY